MTCSRSERRPASFHAAVNRREARHLDVEPIRVRRLQGVRRVVVAAVDVNVDHLVDHRRIREGTIAGQADQVREDRAAARRGTRDRARRSGCPETGRRPPPRRHPARRRRRRRRWSPRRDDRCAARAGCVESAASSIGRPGSGAEPCPETRRADSGLQDGDDFIAGAPHVQHGASASRDWTSATARSVLCWGSGRLARSTSCPRAAISRTSSRRSSSRSCTQGVTPHPTDGSHRGRSHAERSTASAGRAAPPPASNIDVIPTTRSAA